MEYNTPIAITWQFRLYTLFDLTEQSLPQIVSDTTGLLLSSAFLNYLNHKGIRYQIVHRPTDLYRLHSYPNIQLFICPYKTIPDSIANKYTLRHFNMGHLVNGNINLLPQNNLTQLINLLNYLYATNWHTVLSTHNIAALLAESEVFEQKMLIKHLQQQTEMLLQTPATFSTVLQLGKLWGQLVYLSTENQDDGYIQLTQAVDGFAKDFVVQQKINDAFYASTPKHPKVVNKILANIEFERCDKIALLCFDCMGYAEWYLLKDYLVQSGFTFEDIPLFSMLPSTTEISRMAIFSGSSQVYNLKSKGRTAEAKAFAQYFTNRSTHYFTEQDTISNDTLLGYDCVSILYNFLDNLCHTAQFPPNTYSKTLYFKAIKAYLEQVPLFNTLQTLQANGFSIYFCSDHGSVVAQGNGERLERYLSNSFARRAALIPTNAALLVPYEQIPVPFEKNSRIALPNGRSMFAPRDQTAINHGGISIEEIVVPYIKLTTL